MIANHSDIELVGALVHHEEKVGRDVGEIVHLGPLGVGPKHVVDGIL